METLFDVFVQWSLGLEAAKNLEYTDDELAKLLRGEVTEEEIWRKRDESYQLQRS